ncbi:unnamed protein product, partial [Phaeothamnion confervicola]
YAHLLHDHIFFLTWLITEFPPSTKIALRFSRVAHGIIKWLDGSLLERILWYSEEQVTCVPGTALIVDPVAGDYHQFRSTSLVWRFRELITSSHFFREARAARAAGRGGIRRIVLCSRHGAATMHKRLLGNEEELGALVAKLLGEYSREEELYIFDGAGKTIQEQFDIFNSASVVIGAHGSAVANILWVPDEADLPGGRVRVIEAVTGHRSIRVQGPVPYQTSYFWIFGGAPWVQYNHVV